ncbi:MAG: hypothetical protein QSU88_00140, partial [Candidatus Methanoperedens sp.]|nr:hypothetical protein [Candidatus Methanoperedens sp.]
MKCRHCDSYYLGHMLDGSNGKLQSCTNRLAGNNGILLSGGSLPDGSVPTYLHADEIAQIKKDTHLKLSA